MSKHNGFAGKDMYGAEMISERGKQARAVLRLRKRKSIKGSHPSWDLYSLRQAVPLDWAICGAFPILPQSTAAERLSFAILSWR